VSLIVFHPSTAPHVQQAALAIHEAGQLERFITAVRHQPASGRQRLLVAIGRVFGQDLGKEFSRRAVHDLPPELVESHPWGELLRLAVGRMDPDGRATDFVWSHTEPAFDRMVARRLHPPPGGVYGYENSSLATFQRARDLGLRVVYDIPAPELGFTQALLDAELDKFPELRTPYHRYTSRREGPRVARRRAEWDLADLILVNSRFTESSYARAGLDCSKVRVATLGAPPPASRDQAIAGAPPDAPLTLIMAGNFTVAKGAHYVLDAWRSAGLGRHARLRVFGRVQMPDRILHPLPAGIEFCGLVSRPELLGHFGRADALMFPTLCDGFGMVATEAWSRGLPVITTDRAGAADLLKPGVNGLLIRPAESASIAEAVTWCLDHRTELRAMREPALATAAAWQWSDYRRLHASYLRNAGIYGPTT
jgi:glycosyltransferase involved in cell wall biosynthesis